jgi:hypothetical protein
MDPDKPVIDEFEASFNQISAADNAAEAAGKVLNPADIKPVEKTAEQVEAERVAAETAAAEAAKTKTKTPEEIAAEAAAAEAAKTKTPEQIEAERVAAEAATAAEAAKGDDDLIKRLAGVIKRADPQADEAARQAAARQAEADRAAQAEAERVRQEQQQPQLSAEDLAAVQAAEKDFPDVFKASAIVRRAEYRQIVAHVFQEVQRAFDERITPIAQLVQNLAERTHVGDLKTVVPDYDKLDVAKLSEWVGKQPAYLRGGMDQVMKSGSAEDVKDLVTRFYTETGVKQGLTAAPPDPAAAAAAAATAAAAETARKKAIAALAPVQAKRGDTAQPAAPEDYDGAFAMFSKQLASSEASDRFTR